jgi:hypothetical protein
MIEPELALVLTLHGESVVQGLCLELHPDLAVSERLTVLELFVLYALNTASSSNLYHFIITTLRPAQQQHPDRQENI